MGWGVALASIGSGLGILGSGYNAYEEAEGAKFRLQQQIDAETQRSAQRTHRLNEIMASTIAQAGASGYQLSSPSLFTVTNNDFNQYAEDETADNLNLDFDRINAATTEKNAWAGAVIQAGEDAFNFGDSINQGKFSSGNESKGNKSKLPNYSGGTE